MPATSETGTVDDVSHYLFSNGHFSAYHATSKADARKFFVGGNWKCNGSVAKAAELVSMLNQSSLTQQTEVVVCPSQVHLQSVAEKLRPDVAVGAQDVWSKGNGAFTGETSAEMLKVRGSQTRRHTIPSNNSPLSFDDPNSR